MRFEIWLHAAKRLGECVSMAKRTIRPVVELLVWLIAGVSVLGFVQILLELLAKGG